MCNSSSNGALTALTHTGTAASVAAASSGARVKPPDKKGGVSLPTSKSGKTVRSSLAAKHQTGVLCVCVILVSCSTCSFADKTSSKAAKPLTVGGRSTIKSLTSSAATKPSLPTATKGLSTSKSSPLSSRSSSTESLKKATGTAKTTSTASAKAAGAKPIPATGRGKRPASADRLNRSVAATAASDKKGTACSLSFTLTALLPLWSVGTGSPKTRRAGEVTTKGSSKPAVRQEDNKPTAAVRQEDNKPTAAVRQEDNKPTAAVRQEDNKPTAAVRQEDNKPTATQEEEGECICCCY